MSLSKELQFKILPNNLCIHLSIFFKGYESFKLWSKYLHSQLKIPIENRLHHCEIKAFFKNDTASGLLQFLIICSNYMVDMSLSLSIRCYTF